MKDYDAILEVPLGITAYTVGERIDGYIFSDTLTSGNHPFPDGTLVSTSPYVEVRSGGILVTKSGTRYKLRTGSE